MATHNSTKIFLVCLVLTVFYPGCSIACLPGTDILKCVHLFEGLTFLQYLNTTGLFKTLFYTKDATIFLPSNGAFRKLQPDVTSDNNTMREILLYHILPKSVNISTLTNEQLLLSSTPAGQSVRFNNYSNVNKTLMTVSGAVILRSDENATNGVINLVDRVMYPPPTGSLYEYIANTKSYQTLLLLAAKAQILDTLKDGTYTLFAPNDDAFSKLPSGAIANLLSDIPKLKKVLENHIVLSTMYSAGLGVIGTGKTLSGGNFTANTKSVKFGSVNATMVSADRSATNGVLHEIDSVLM
ncbi:transforming growth factor-beta-induced protein ig-h3-like [Ylistrum balloti]|uniref:transforming growth factor-beta-induced protein ig-h3-like n=1 Tax=Ylistrum balloti TaxID=509963 RepID=UPI002905AC9A|nr:transforming growth factor-beta-induced protein ig-h3-like [Ylistrum balloti]